MAINLQGRIILVDKPLRWTSFDVVKAIRRRFHLKKAGHAGTLDPMATGLLVLCANEATKQIASLQAQEKEYIGAMKLGQTTPSYDTETEATPPVDVSHISPEQVREITAKFIGEIDQTPPAYSAIKIDGQRAYKMARAGKPLTLAARKTTITQFEVDASQLPYLSFRVVCSKGTYIRSLAHDFGQTLGVGAYLASLRRTRIGSFLVEDALCIASANEDIQKH